ncbi:MAG: hypothetical protein HY308_13785 [Gammaproteobacteria bacterium]|nr:hypothetical protein [Gammaproteobacteria bacterium]
MTDRRSEDFADLMDIKRQKEEQQKENMPLTNWDDVKHPRNDDEKNKNGL